jgi:hypothetical protein
MTNPEQYVRLVLAPRTRIGVIIGTKQEHGRTQYLFHLDERFSDGLPDFWVEEVDFEQCERPSDDYVATINALIKRGM